MQWNKKKEAKGRAKKTKPFQGKRPVDAEAMVSKGAPTDVKRSQDNEGDVCRNGRNKRRLCCITVHLDIEQSISKDAYLAVEAGWLAGTEQKPCGRLQVVYSIRRRVQNRGAYRTDKSTGQR